MTRLSLSRRGAVDVFDAGDLPEQLFHRTRGAFLDSLALEPGMETITSTIGTLICGSSSRGSSTTAAAPSKTDAMTTSGVSLESMNACRDAACDAEMTGSEGSLMAGSSRVGHRRVLRCR
jgi:hypothetical protein